LTRYTVDRIEDKFAVCIDENDNTINIELSKFDFKITEGLYIMYDDVKDCFYPDYSNTKKHKTKNRKRLKNLFGRGK